MNIPETELNRRLANSLHNRIAADGLVVAGRAAFWRLVGLGFLAFGMGAATGVGFWGYSFVTRNADNFTALSSIFAKSLSELQLRAVAEGTVQLQPAEVRLARDQTVSLTNGSEILLDPAAKVKAEGELKLQGPTISRIQSGSQPSPKTPIISNFTVFKGIPFGNGDVMTGWIFLTSAQKAPTRQYCYYTENAETPGLNISLDLGTDERPEVPKIPPKDFDVKAAFSRCVWFKSGTQ